MWLFRSNKKEKGVYDCTCVWLMITVITVASLLHSVGTKLQRGRGYAMQVRRDPKIVVLSDLLKERRDKDRSVTRAKVGVVQIWPVVYPILLCLVPFLNHRSSLHLTRNLDHSGWCFVSERRSYSHSS